MSTQPIPNPRSYKLSLIIYTAVGAIMLLLAIVGGICEASFPAVPGHLAWGFIPATLITWLIASLLYAKYLNLSK